ncbi:hypothetical protein [Hymenobacter ruber]
MNTFAFHATLSWANPSHMIFRFAPCLFCFVLGSCCTRTVLAPSERAWLRPYSTGERVVFRSNRGTVDTLLVTRKEEFYTNEGCNWFEIGPFKQHSISLDLRPVHCRPHVTCSMAVNIRKDRPERPSLPYFDFLGLEYGTAANVTTMVRSLTLTTTHKTYPNAYFFAAGFNATNIGKGYLQSFDWDQTDGLIRYEAQDGEIFELVEKRP